MESVVTDGRIREQERVLREKVRKRLQIIFVFSDLVGIKKLTFSGWAVAVFDESRVVDHRSMLLSTTLMVE